jgi:hypothetical protein
MTELLPIIRRKRRPLVEDVPPVVLLVTEPDKQPVEPVKITNVKKSRDDAPKN